MGMPSNWKSLFTATLDELYEHLVAKKTLMLGLPEIIAHEQAIFEIASAFSPVMEILECDQKLRQRIISQFVSYCSPTAMRRIHTKRLDLDPLMALFQYLRVQAIENEDENP